MNEKSPVTLQSKDENIALHCPHCGTSAHFVQAECGYCGTGLMKKDAQGRNKFLIPAAANEIVIDEQMQRMRLAELVKYMNKTISNPEEYVFTIWRGSPILCGSNITDEEAMDNWYANQRALKREALGDSWTNALQQFNQLRVDMEATPLRKRIAAGTHFIDDFKGGLNRLVPPEINQFFRTPSFSLMEEVMGMYPGSNDAKLLSTTISDIRSFIPKPIQKVG